MKLTWLSDIHLEFLTMDRARRFLERVKQGRPDAVLFTGDISTAPEIRHHLRLMAEILKCPIYFGPGSGKLGCYGATASACTPGAH